LGGYQYVTKVTKAAFEAKEIPSRALKPVGLLPFVIIYFVKVPFHNYIAAAFTISGYKTPFS